MKAFERASPKAPLPVVLLLLCGGLLVLILQLGLARPWTPPFMGQAHLSAEGADDWELVVDTRAWPELDRLNSLLPPSSSPLQADQIYRIRDKGESFKVSPGKSADTWGPRASLSFVKDGLEFRAKLFQPQVGVGLLSGPIKAKLPSQFFRPQSGGVDLGALRLLPLDVERVLLVDTKGIEIPDTLWLALKKEWKRWEFEPEVALTGAFSSPFVYADWRGNSVLICALESPSALEEELERRFPSSLIQSTARWSHGNRLVGFEEDRHPAWYFRGDFLLATPVGGTERLVELLESQSRDLSFRDRDPFLLELQRLAEGEKGWHLCIIERSAKKAVHWAALLRWSEASGLAEGHLIVDLKPRPAEPPSETKDSPS